MVFFRLLDSQFCIFFQNMNNYLQIFFAGFYFFGISSFVTRVEENKSERERERERERDRKLNQDFFQ